MTPLDDVVTTFRRWLHLPDPGALYAVLGAVAANRMVDDPVWLLLVGPSGGGKSELLSSLRRLPDVHTVAAITEAGLLSGTPSRQRSKAATGGLLNEIGPRGIILAKDFGSVLNMHHDARSRLLAALREIYDGAWSRHIGSDGARSLSWSGRVGFVGGCTTSIDEHHAVMAEMGERFVLYRLPPIDEDAQADSAMVHLGFADEMRSELTESVAGLLGAQQAVDIPVLEEGERREVRDLATLAVRGRSTVRRDRYTREIDFVPEPEAPGRLSLVLARLLTGMRSVGVPDAVAWGVLAKLSLDSMPVVRQRLLLRLSGEDGGMLGTAVLAEVTPYSEVTVRRHLEDLEAVGLLSRMRGEYRNHPDLWALSAFAHPRLSTAVSAMAHGLWSGGAQGGLSLTGGKIAETARPDAEQAVDESALPLLQDGDRW